MNYEKAKAVVTDFSGMDIFMAMSGHAAMNWILNNCTTFKDENPNGVSPQNGKFRCSVFTDSKDGTFSHSGNSDNWFCLSISD